MIYHYCLKINGHLVLKKYIIRIFDSVYESFGNLGFLTFAFKNILFVLHF